MAQYRRTLPEHGRGPEPAPAFATVAEGFAQQVRRTPDASAVATGQTLLAYAELDARAAALAAALRHRLPADPAPRPPSRCIWSPRSSTSWRFWPQPAST